MKKFDVLNQISKAGVVAVLEVKMLKKQLRFQMLASKVELLQLN